MITLNLHNARKNKNDEFYTRLCDIEKELLLYKKELVGKIIYCNCDDPKKSNFWKYFKDNFKELGIKKVISTHYDTKENTYKIEFDGINETKEYLKGYGDFRSEECIEILKKSDFIITNPPFSLFRKFLDVLMVNKKKFLIIGTINCGSYIKTFEYFKKDEIFISKNHPVKYKFPNGDIKIINVCRWYTNIIEHKKEFIKLKKTNEYIKYDNYEAISIDRIKDIPLNYNGLIGVPITIIEKYNKEQFELLYAKSNLKINGEQKFKRIIIKRVKKYATR
jgi:hypothetical protein